MKVMVNSDKDGFVLHLTKTEGLNIAKALRILRNTPLDNKEYQECLDELRLGIADQRWLLDNYDPMIDDRK